MTRALLIAALLVACAKKAEPPPAETPVPAMPAAEIQRSQEACTAYVDRVCQCAAKVPAAKQQCDLARSLPDAVRLALEVAANPETKRADALSAQESVRKTAKECFEQAAKLPALGCP